MKRLAVCAVAVLLTSGALAIKPAAASSGDCSDCTSWCRSLSQGYEDGVCSPGWPYHCICF